MGKVKQTTLLESWGVSRNSNNIVNKRVPVRKNSSNAERSKEPPYNSRRTVKRKAPLLLAKSSTSLNSHNKAVASASSACEDLNSSDDDELLQALEASMVDSGDSQNKRVDTKEPQPGCSEADSGSGLTAKGFDEAAGNTWVFPTNFPVRQYQFNIAERALAYNTLVSLPTGLGKTFIAAVVMYNFFRWFPRGKVVFLAPTKPLVAQQIEACFKIMGLPANVMAEMTGSMPAAGRKLEWLEKRVFFLTPQVMVNDLTRSACPAESIKCVVIDEAHRALGNHAYCQVIRELLRYTKEFRVLGLSATPGTDVKNVQQIVTNLLIARMELRSDDSPDVVPYCHERKLEKIVVPIGDQLQMLKYSFLRIMSAQLSKLEAYRVLYHRDPASWTKFQLLKQRDNFRRAPPPGFSKNLSGIVEGIYAILLSLYHAYDLLLLHGMKSFYNFLQGLLEGQKSNPRVRAELLRDKDFADIMSFVKEQNFGDEAEENSFRSDAACLEEPSTSTSAANTSAHISPGISHPKLSKLRGVLVEHFSKFPAGDQSTRVMVFSQYRESVSEICEVLKKDSPLIRVAKFVGQTTGKGKDNGFTQKEQMKVVEDFHSGCFNTLVCTCIGEEGLDIGEVDLIVCYDAPTSPIRLVQRMGRTGRKREGRIVVLVTEGKEEQMYNQSEHRKKTVHKAILTNKNFRMYDSNPRMLRKNIMLKCVMLNVTVPDNSDGLGAFYKKHNTSNSPGIRAHLGKKELPYLNADDLRHWEQHFKTSVEDRVVSFLSVPKLCSLKSQKEVEKPRGSSANFYPSSATVKYCALSEYSQWQTSRLSGTTIGPSTRCQVFIKLMKKVEFWKSNASLDSDPFDLFNNDLDLESGDNGDTGNRNAASKTRIRLSASRNIERFCVKNCEIKWDDTSPAVRKAILTKKAILAGKNQKDGVVGKDNDGDCAVVLEVPHFTAGDYMSFVPRDADANETFTFATCPELNIERLFQLIELGTARSENMVLQAEEYSKSFSRIFNQLIDDSCSVFTPESPPFTPESSPLPNRVVAEPVEKTGFHEETSEARAISPDYQGFEEAEHNMTLSPTNSDLLLVAEHVEACLTQDVDVDMVSECSQQECGSDFELFSDDEAHFRAQSPMRPASVVSVCQTPADIYSVVVATPLHLIDRCTTFGGKEQNLKNSAFPDLVESDLTLVNRSATTTENNSTLNALATKMHSASRPYEGHYAVIHNLPSGLPLPKLFNMVRSFGPIVNYGFNFSQSSSNSDVKTGFVDFEDETHALEAVAFLNCYKMHDQILRVIYRKQVRPKAHSGVESAGNLDAFVRPFLESSLDEFDLQCGYPVRVIGLPNFYCTETWLLRKCQGHGEVREIRLFRDAFSAIKLVGVCVFASEVSAVSFQKELSSTKFLSVSCLEVKIIDQGDFSTQKGPPRNVWEAYRQINRVEYELPSTSMPSQTNRMPTLKEEPTTRPSFNQFGSSGYSGSFGPQLPMARVYENCRSNDYEDDDLSFSDDETSNAESFLEAKDAYDDLNLDAAFVSDPWFALDLDLVSANAASKCAGVDVSDAGDAATDVTDKIWAREFQKDYIMRIERLPLYFTKEDVTELCEPSFGTVKSVDMFQSKGVNVCFVQFKEMMEVVTAALMLHCCILKGTYRPLKASITSGFKGFVKSLGIRVARAFALMREELHHKGMVPPDSAIVERRNEQLKRLAKTQSSRLTTTSTSGVSKSFRSSEMYRRSNTSTN